jgi:hypothetical protein
MKHAKTQKNTVKKTIVRNAAIVRNLRLSTSFFFNQIGDQPSVRVSGRGPARAISWAGTGECNHCFPWLHAKPDHSSFEIRHYFGFPFVQLGFTVPNRLIGKATIASRKSNMRSFFPSSSTLFFMGGGASPNHQCYPRHPRFIPTNPKFKICGTGSSPGENLSLFGGLIFSFEVSSSSSFYAARL